MSKLRQDVPPADGDLATPEERDLRAYVIFTQLKADGPYLYAGWLDAVDDAMAVQFAREHYGQDQACTALWAIPREAIAGTEPYHAPRGGEGPTRRFQVFTQQQPGDGHVSAGSVEAPGSAAALEAARREHGACHGVWVVDARDIVATAEGDLIWRHSDQSYRLARGYSKEVRSKWEQVRARRDVDEYEKEDLKETF